LAGSSEHQAVTDRTGAVTFTWNGTPIKAVAGDSVAAALWRAGITSLARSRKLHRHLGYSGSFTAGVLARVDGRPNVRIDQTMPVEGMAVEIQNTWPSARFDLLSLARLLPASAVYGGFEHGDWMPSSGLGYRLAERMMAHLAGVARPADPASVPAVRTGRRLAVDCLIAGAGPAGISEANRRVADGASVALVTRGHRPARFARALGAEVEPLDGRVQLFTGMELFGVYRAGGLVVAAPHDHRAGAIVFEPKETVLATGRRSIPPLVQGNYLPGVLDAAAALQLALDHGVPLGRSIAVIGTGAEREMADRLAAAGANIVHVGPVGGLRQIRGRARVQSIVTARTIDCDTLVHAGPWRIDPSLGFQASSDGVFQMQAGPLPDRVRVIGSAALGDEAIAAPQALHRDTLICPCMDVTAGELYHHIDAGEEDPEVLKRLTSCGMGTCQGFPCWENMLALLAARTGRDVETLARPTHRPPRRAITVAQAAGLAGLVEPDR
jgi:hypothetical protein